jgi:ADP-heptose:LPS heptosyltransferase
MYASCIADAQKVCKTVILECDKRLEGLFKRSFPGARVYGTRRQNEVEWLQTETVEASLPVGQLPQFFRKSPKDCPGTPYLIADPERRTQWRALFDSWGPRPKIGICWSGGSKHNKPKERAVGLENMRQLIESVDADFVSLQYKDPTEEIKASGLHVRHYKRACETDDYDDTAAMVAELDMVIGVHTTAHHLAGALGVPALILVPSRTIWIYCLPDGSMPWYGSAQLFKQREREGWKETIKRLCHEKSGDLRRPRSARGGGVPRLQRVIDSAREPADSYRPPSALAVA